MAVLTGALISTAINGVKEIAGKYFDNKEQEEKFVAEFRTKVLDVVIEELRTSVAIIVAEAKGDSWLQRNWRPITMLTFVGLVVAKWLGWTAEGVTEVVELQLMELIKIGLGGYVIGRSVEKTAKIVAPAIKEGMRKRRLGQNANDIFEELNPDG